MTDSWTQSDIDRVYGRLQVDINLSKVRSIEDLKREVSKTPNTKYWNDTLNVMFYGMLRKDGFISPPESYITKRRAENEYDRLLVRVRGSIMGKTIVSETRRTTYNIERWKNGVVRPVVRLKNGRFAKGNHKDLIIRSLRNV